MAVPLGLMRNHVGAHILLEPDWSKHGGKQKPKMPCGLCGVGDAVMCSSRIAADQVPGCPVSAAMVRPPAGGPATLKPQHQCKVFGGPSYSLTTSAKCVVSTPCTNRPVVCPICSNYSWSYNMAAHVSSGDCRGGASSAAVRSCEPGHHEREWLQPFLTSNRSKLKACKVAGCPCKSAPAAAGSSASGAAQQSNAAGKRKATAPPSTVEL